MKTHARLGPGGIQLLVIDLDGTSLDPNHKPYARFSRSFCRFLDGISKQGCLWCINTTWDVNGQWDLVLNSPVKSRPVFLMGELGKSLARVGKDGPVMMEEYNRIMERKSGLCNKKYLTPIIRKIVGKFCPERMYFYGHLFSFVARKKDAGKLHAYARETLSEISEITLYYNRDAIMLCPSFLNKGDILAKVEKMLGFLPEEIVIAGDSIIDLPMMTPKLGKYLICPANAEDKVKKMVRMHKGVVASKSFSGGIMEGFP